MNKICTICNFPKDVSEFSWRQKSKGIRHAQCRECKRIKDNEHYLKSKKRRDSVRNRAKEQTQYIRSFVQRVKKLNKCSKCGEKRWYLLDFHHIKGKDFSISGHIRSAPTIEKIKNEIRKCIILCSNCHRELHHFKRNKKK